MTTQTLVVPKNYQWIASHLAESSTDAVDARQFPIAQQTVTMSSSLLHTENNVQGRLKFLFYQQAAN